uniref:Uncharacterized protein n=1 Tax=Molossus molossus TaxID=27622 RepID=A0A7J8FYY5_MOLMO|nr:hypothetical protein HJG59_008182 [Molossus molossus]
MTPASSGHLRQGGRRLREASAGSGEADAGSTLLLVGCGCTGPPTADPASCLTTCPVTAGKGNSGTGTPAPAAVINCFRSVPLLPPFLRSIIPSGSSLIPVLPVRSLLNILLVSVDSGNLSDLLFPETVMLDVCWLCSMTCLATVGCFRSEAAARVVEEPWLEVSWLNLR